MGSEQWQKIKQIFNDALQVGAEERDAYLENACTGDAELRREVEDLLASFGKAEGFMDSPAAHDAASLIIESSQKPDTGELIAHYEVISQIGEGGMGEVYLAKDTRLNRKVALKLLSSHITDDKDHVGRFRQEAFATSALNHPNIVTIYEIGEWHGRDFIATEFIDGSTLRDLLKKKKLSIAEALDIALQVTSALVAAHGAGIVHRDVKPENIMIRPDGLVKVLDFGIAKYNPGADGRKALVETKVGEVIGTAAYMSPEQARGLDIDERTDIWSQGVILYEMLAGKLPFEGGTRSDRIAAILNQEPKPISSLRSGLPPNLEITIGRALVKDKEKRYGKMSELAEDLHGIRERSGIERRSAFSMPSLRAGRRSAWLYAAGAAALILIAVGLGLYLTGSTSALTKYFNYGSPLSLQTMKITRLSDTSQAVDVAISPDGEFVVSIKEKDGKQSLWLRQISAISSIQLVPPSGNVIFASPTFSSNGSHIYYLKVDGSSTRASLYQIPKIGGEEKRLAGDISIQDSKRNFSLSPDGKQVSFIRLDEGFNRSLVITDLDGNNVHTLTSRRLPNFLTGAAWSPDGKSVVTYARKFGGKADPEVNNGLISVSTEDLSERPLTQKQWKDFVGMAWLPDMSGMIVSASEERPGLLQLWHISVPGGDVSRVTNDLSDYAAPSVTSGKTVVAAVQINQNSNIWSVAANENGFPGKQLTFANGGNDGRWGVSRADNGNIVYTSHATGNPELRVVNSDRSVDRQVTDGIGICVFPSFSPDGRYIVFNLEKDSESGIWRIDPDGKDLTFLTRGTLPTFSPDSQRVFYYINGVVWNIPVDGGEPVRIQLPERDLATAPVVSQDSKMIAANYLVGEPNAEFKIGVIPVNGGKPIKVFDKVTYAIKGLRWTPDGRGVSFIDTHNGISNIWRHRLDQQKAERITDFTSGTIWNFDWSGDGRTLILARGDVANDVVLITEFR